MASTGYYAADGGILPIFSCGRVKLAPSFLTGTGMHSHLWCSLLIHIAALATNLAANVAFMVNSYDNSTDLLKGWALVSIAFHCLAVVTVLVTTGIFRDVFDKIIINTLVFGFMLAGLMATLQASYTHAIAQPANSVENGAHSTPKITVVCANTASNC
jgi:hypothetical protein